MTSDQRAEDRAARIDVVTLHAHTALPETALSRRLDAAILRIGDAASWIWVGLLCIIVANVILRYAFAEGRIEFEEIQWHLYATGFLAALSYGVVLDDHIRVDFLHVRLSPRTRAWVDWYGILLLLLPFVALMLVYSAPFVARSFAQGEISSAPGGLPYRWIVKSALFGGFALLGVSAFSRLLRLASFLFGSPAALEDTVSDRCR